MIRDCVEATRYFAQAAAQTRRRDALSVVSVRCVLVPCVVSSSGVDSGLCTLAEGLSAERARGFGRAYFALCVWCHASWRALWGVEYWLEWRHV